MDWLTCWFTANIRPSRLFPPHSHARLRCTYDQTTNHISALIQEYSYHSRDLMLHLNPLSQLRLCSHVPSDAFRPIGWEFTTSRRVAVNAVGYISIKLCSLFRCLPLEWFSSTPLRTQSLHFILTLNCPDRLTPLKGIADLPTKTPQRKRH
jgi:hypothetical protein